jgi:hypothetical protein
MGAIMEVCQSSAAQSTRPLLVLEESTTVDAKMKDLFSLTAGSWSRSINIVTCSQDLVFGDSNEKN